MTDSAGAGKYRGGATSEVAFTPHGVDEITLKLTNTAGTEQTNAHGIEGGYPGAGSQSVIVREADVDLFSGPVPEITAMGEKIFWMPSKADEVIRKGDVYGFWAAGGGGFGDPLQREIEAVAEDIRAQTVTAGEAERLYGVVLDGHGNSDNIASAKRRHEIRESRITAVKTVKVTDGPPCGDCGKIGDYGILSHPLRHAGPLIALRYGGDGPNFELEETICRSCGALAGVREILKESRNIQGTG